MDTTTYALVVTSTVTVAVLLVERIFQYVYTIKHSTCCGCSVDTTATEGLSPAPLPALPAAPFIPGISAVPNKSIVGEFFNHEDICYIGK